MNEVRVKSISFELYCHATESLDRVNDALKFCCATDTLAVDQFPVQYQHVTGGYGNPIIVVKCVLEDEGTIAMVYPQIVARLSPADKITLFNRFELQLDEKKHFYLRFDKQAAAQQRLALGTEDPLKVNIHFDMGFTRRSDVADKIKKFCIETHIIGAGG